MKNLINIIIFDENQKSIDELSNIIKSIGPEFKVKGFLSAQKGLEHLLLERVDIAFVDIMMSSVSGYEIAKKIIFTYPYVRTVLMSTSESYALEAFEIGVDNYILKAFDSKMINKILNGLLIK